MRRMPKRDRFAEYDRSVFLNCPFDRQYRPLFEAIVFCVMAYGYRIRCALEVEDSGEVRLHKIVRIIEECRLGIHDLSRTEHNEHGLPRFNMPLELGMFIGAKLFGDRRQKTKSCMILDRERYRYQVFISDIAGQDIRSHDNEVGAAIVAVREWLAQFIRVPPGPEAVQRHYKAFQLEMPEICNTLGIRLDEVTFSDLIVIISSWLEGQPLKARQREIT